MIRIIGGGALLLASALAASHVISLEKKKIDQLETFISLIRHTRERIDSYSMPLEKMIDKISEGVKLIRFCRKRLDTLNSKVEILFKDDGAEGEFAEFDSATDRAKATGTAAPAARKKSAPQPENPNQDQLPF